MSRPSTSLLVQSAPSIVLACDVSDLARLESLADAACCCPDVGAFKIGCTLALRYGLGEVVKRIRERSKLPIIYDHQKGATDIPDLSVPFASTVEFVDAVIIFPMAGPATQRAFTSALQSAGKRVIVGALMTHPQFLESDGGYIADQSIPRILELAIELSVRDFIVPSNNPAAITAQRAIIERHLSADQYDLYSPGLIAQGGQVQALRSAAGPRWHGIVGRAVYEASDPQTTLSSLAAMLRGEGDR